MSLVNVENFNVNYVESNQGSSAQLDKLDKLDKGAQLGLALAKVFIPNRSGHDFSASKVYGSPIYITTGEINRFSVGNMARRWMRCLLESTKEDYILITSLTILTVVGAAIFGWLHGCVNILIYRNDRYIARKVNFVELKQAIEDQNKEAGDVW